MTTLSSAKLGALMRRFVLTVLCTFLLPQAVAASPVAPDAFGPFGPHAVPEPPYIHVQRSGANAQLYWLHVGIDAAYYEIYRSTSPYPEPQTPPANRISDLPASAYATGSEVQYLDDGKDRYADDGTLLTVQVIGDVQTNYFWVVQARSSSNETSGGSNLVGEFDFSLARGS